MMSILKQKQRSISRKVADSFYGHTPARAQYLVENKFGSVEYYRVTDDVLYKFDDSVGRWIKTDIYPMFVTTLPETKVISG